MCEIKKKKEKGYDLRKSKARVLLKSFYSWDRAEHHEWETTVDTNNLCSG